MNDSTMHANVALIGAGPIGLETAIELKKNGIDYLHFEKGQIASTIMRYPPGTLYFSSPERIAIAGIPISNVGQTKTTKEQYIAYLRSVAETFDLQINMYEPVQRIGGNSTSGFEIHTTTAFGSVQHVYHVAHVVLAVGDMEFPRRLQIPGEDLPHVTHTMQDPHVYFGCQVLIVGGKNSAAEAALRCFRVGAHVTVSYRKDQFSEKSIKYWIYPELTGLIRRGAIKAYFSTQPSEITSTHVLLSSVDRLAEPIQVPSDFVLLLTGYQPDQSLLKQLGVDLAGEQRAPQCSSKTMETNVPGVFVAGTAAAGEQLRFRLFIENCHIHTKRIAHALSGQEPPMDENPWDLPEN